MRVTLSPLTSITPALSIVAIFFICCDKLKRLCRCIIHLRHIIVLNKEAKMKKTITVFILTFLFIGIGMGFIHYYRINSLEKTVYLSAGERKYSYNLDTYKCLHNKKIASVKITTDNQGSYDTLYYVGKINNRYYGFLFKDRGILRKAKLIYIKKIDE